MKSLSALALVLSTSVSLASGQLMSNYYPEEQNAIDVFKKMSPLVINVTNRQSVQTHKKQKYLYDVAFGSGFFWDQSGYIVTNNHVIAGATRVTVTLRPGVTVPATVVGAAPSRDIALLKLAPEVKVADYMPFKQMPIADSDELTVGQIAYAIGNPYGLDRSMSKGIISALERRVPEEGGVTLHGLIQTDTAINHGNSGGPLLDIHGHIIGMTTLGLSGGDGSIGLNFAISSNEIKRTVNQLIKYGKISKISIGIHRFNDKVAEELGIEGVIIAEVLENSPAAKAGLHGSTVDKQGNIVVGDVIVAINDKPVKDFEDFYTVLDEVGGDQQVSLTIQRNGKTQTVAVMTLNKEK